MTSIQNKDTLARTPLRKVALEIVGAGLSAIQTERVINNNIHVEGDSLFIQETELLFKDIDHVYVVGVGKCALDAAILLEQILGDHITDGVVIDVREDVTQSLKRIRPFAGTHPLPSDTNIEATQELINLLEQTSERDVVIAVISGGGSTLLCQPKTHRAEDEAQLFTYLTSKGTTIQELNTVRKHLSSARGGNIATLTSPARLFSLIFSDVPGDDMSFVASGPTVLDTTTVDNARAVLQKYDVQSIGFSEEHLFETPKDESLFATTTNLLVLTNKTALVAMAELAQSQGFSATIVDTTFSGESRDVAHTVLTRLHSASPQSILLFGGETTVTIRGGGKGGRNQEFALAALPALHDGEVLISLASDGRDNSDHAGAIVDTDTLKRAQAQGMDPKIFLDNNDSYTFFHTLGDELITGYTGENVADLVIAIKA